LGAILRAAGILAVAAVVAAGGGGCVRRPGGPGGRANELRYPLAMEPDSLDMQASNSVVTGELLQNVYEGLLMLDAETKLAPCVADKWETSSDGRTYTFHIDPRAKFSNGRKVVASDVKWTLERWCWPETKAPNAQPVMQYVIGGNDVMAGRRRDLPGVRVIDPATVAITIDRPRAYMLYEVGTVGIMCREAVESGHGKFGSPQAVGTGPFVLKSYEPGRRVVLEANRDYFRGRPPLDRIIRPVVVSSETSHMQFENGEIDACAASLVDFARDRETPKLRDQCRVVNTGSVSYVAMDVRLLPVFRDPRVRLAFARAIDRDAIARVAYHGLCPRMDGVLPPGVVGNDPTARRLTYDPAAAKALLAEAGYPGGKGFPTLTLAYIQSSPNYSATAQIVRDNLKQNLGIEVNLQEREQATLIADLNANRLPFCLMRWTAIDPHDFLPTMLGAGSAQNHVGYRNPAFDRLCDQADAEMDTAKRAALYRRADDLAMADAPIIPLVNSGEFWLINPRVRDMRSNLGGMLPHYTTRVAR
jgi:ABC-type transport system substrate-binding protein